MTMRRKAALAALAWSLDASALAQQPAAPAAWSLRLPQQQAVAFRGVVNFDKAGKGVSNTTYMMPGIAGFAAALAAHSLVINAGLEKQKNDIELEADKVLQPYLPVLDALRQDELMAQALARTAPGNDRKLIPYLDQDEGAGSLKARRCFL